MVPAYEGHCRQTIPSSFQNKGDFVGAVSVKTNCHIMLSILRQTIFQLHICKIVFILLMKLLGSSWTTHCAPCQAGALTCISTSDAWHKEWSTCLGTFRKGSEVLGKTLEKCALRSFPRTDTHFSTNASQATFVVRHCDRLVAWQVYNREVWLIGQDVCWTIQY